MAQSLGSLVVSLGLDAAQYFSGLTKAQYEAEKISRGISNALNAVGVGLSLGAITAWGRGVVQAAEHLRNLSTETGSTVEELSRLANITKISGASFDTFQTMIDRLAAGMGGAEEKSTRIGEALRLIGVNASDPAQALQQVADKLAKFADGATKAAIARELFGRGGVQFLSTLDAIAQKTDVAASKTTEQAVAATNLAETIRKLTIDAHAFADILLTEVVPALSRTISAITEASKIKGGLFAGLGLVAGVNPFISVDENIKDTERQIGELQATIAGVKANAGGFWAKIAPSSQETGNLEKGIVTLEQQLKLLQKLKADSLGNLDFLNKDRRPFAPALPAKTGGGFIDDPAKKVLEGQIKALESSIGREKDLLTARADFLRDYFSEGLLSVADYYAQLQAARNTELNNIIQFYNQEIAVQQQLRAASKDAGGRQDATNKIADIQEKQNKLLRDAETAEAKLGRERLRNSQEYIDQIEELNAKLHDLAGNTAAAASIRFDAQTRTFSNLLKTTRDQPGQDAQAQIKAQIVAQSALNDQSQKYSAIIEQIANAQARIDLLAQTGALTEIEAINKRADLARKYVDELRRLADVQASLAAGLAPGPAQEAALQNIARMRLEIDALAASVDVLAKKFNDIGSGATTTFLTDLISGTKSVKQAFIDMAKTIEQQVSRIAAQNISETLFKKDGLLGGFGTGLAGLFGGRPQPERVGISTVSGVGADAVITSLGTAATAAEVALGTFTPTVTAADLALVTFAPSVSTADLGLVTLSGSLAAASDSALAFALAAKTPVTVDVPGAAQATAAATTDASITALASSVALADASVIALATSTTAADASAVALATSTTVADAGLVALTASLAAASTAALAFATAATAASVSSVASGGGDFLKLLAELGLSGFAAGGDPPVGKISIVGERGPELFIPKVSGTIIPASTSAEIMRRVFTHDGTASNGSVMSALPSRTNMADAAVAATAGLVNAATNVISGLTTVLSNVARMLGVSALEGGADRSLQRIVNQSTAKPGREVTRYFLPTFTPLYEFTGLPAIVRRQASLANNAGLLPVKQFQLQLLMPRIAATVRGVDSVRQGAPWFAKSAIGVVKAALTFPPIAESMTAARVLEAMHPSAVVNDQRAGQVHKYLPSDQVANAQKIIRSSSPDYADADRLLSLFTQQLKIQSFATGGIPPLNRPSLIGEDGPELWIPRSAGTIIPNSEFSSSGTRDVVVNQTINVLPGATRQAASQAGAEAGRGVRRALVRET